jgi:predicted site-specific integrase-resolvase
MAALPRFVPLPKAAEQLEMREDELRRLVDSGKIDAIALPDGDVAVSEDDMTEPLRKEDLPEYKRFDHLKNETTWVAQAARDFNVPHPTISRWVSDGYIEIVGTEGNKKLLSAQDVAYCARIYNRYKEKGTQGRRIFDDNGIPYKPKTGPFARSKEAV